jgi:hypothetical protein
VRHLKIGFSILIYVLKAAFMGSARDALRAENDLSREITPFGNLLSIL